MDRVRVRRRRSTGRPRRRQAKLSGTWRPRPARALSGPPRPPSRARPLPPPSGRRPAPVRGGAARPRVHSPQQAVARTVARMAARPRIPTPVTGQSGQARTLPSPDVRAEQARARQKGSGMDHQARCLCVRPSPIPKRRAAGKLRSRSARPAGGGRAQAVGLRGCAAAGASPRRRTKPLAHVRAPARRAGPARRRRAGPARRRRAARIGRGASGRQTTAQTVAATRQRRVEGGTARRRSRCASSRSCRQSRRWS